MLLLFLGRAGGTAFAGLDSNSTVFVILMENHNWVDIKGSASAPYINNTLLPMASYCDQYYNPPAIHPSLPNYLWLEAGTNFGILNDSPPSTNHQTTTSHFVTQLKNAGISWKTYQENISGATCPTTDSYPYYVKHNPFAYFDDVTVSGCTSVMRPLTELAGDLSANNIARYNFITPNICSDMHDSCAPTNNPIKQGDDWLAQYVPMILSSAAYQNNGLLIITWDEGASGLDGPIGTIVLSPQARGGGFHNAIRYTHSATLRTLQKIFGRTPFLGGAANGPDLSDLFVNGAIPGADSPGVTTTAASNVAAGNATLGGSVNPNSDQTQAWFEYGLTTSYGSDTRSRSNDDAESYSTWAYGSNGGTGFGAITYREGSGGGIYLETGGAKIDGAKSFGMFAGTATGNTQAADRQILNAKASGTLTLSVRWNVTNTVSFSGFNLKSAQGTTFGANEIISVGIRPGNGNNLIAVNGGAQTIDLGSDIRGQIVDLLLNYDGLSGTYQLGAKFRGSTGYSFTTGNLRLSNVTPAYIGFGNFNTGNAQNVIFDNLVLVDSASAGNGTSAVATSASITGLTPNTTYHYRAVAQNTRGTTYGSDRAFGFALVPPPNAPYHSTTSTSGLFQARVYDDTGHIQIAEPDLNGAPFGNLITFAPPSAKIAGASYDFGRILSVTDIANGIQIVQEFGGSTITAQLTFTSDGVAHYEVTNWNGFAPTETDITGSSDASEHFYGFGEKFNALDQSGNKVHMMTNDQGGDKNDYSYKSSPWFISTRGYGFHLDSTAESYFDMRNGAADRYVIQNLLGSLKFNIVGGPLLTDVLSRYTAYTGRPYLPPPWVFGTWVSSDIWRDGGEVRYAITKHLQSGIPISVFVFDSPWETAYNDFTWNLTQFGIGNTYEGQFYSGFSSVTEMMTFLQQNGVKVVCWMTPFIDTSSNNEGVPGQNLGQASNYAAGAANNYFVRSSVNGPPLSIAWWKGTGSPVDFTNPAAAVWLTGQLASLVSQSNVPTANSLLEPAIGGFKTDDGEALNAGQPYIPTTAVYYDGRTGIEMRNGYSIEYHKTISSVLGANGILFARSGFTGTGAFPAGWPGDNQPNYTQTNGFQSVITAGVSAAMSGYSIWGSDIGAYQNANFTANHADLFMRWAQYGALSPIMQMHRQVNSGNLEQYPWGYGTTALANYVTYAKLHSQLFPYIYTYAKQASTTGLPLIRPEVLLNQTDTGTFGIQHTYYFGNELLVAPMNAATSTTRNVYLPAGNWYDFWTNTKYTGGQNLSWSNTDTTKMPLFVREGAIVPMLANVPQTLCDANYVNNPAITTIDSALQFLVYPGPNLASFNMYDGTTAQCSASGTVTTFTVSANARPIRLKVFANTSPFGAERNGVRLPHLTTQNDFDLASLGWFYDSANKFLLVKFDQPNGSSTVTFGPDSVGDGITDSWRAYYGITDDNADDDSDGISNGQEYFAGTSPHDSQSQFTVTSLAAQLGGGFLVTWQSQPGIPYRVQWKNNLLDATWIAITPDLVGTGAVMTWFDDGSQTGGLNTTQRFYRVVVP
ncbi:MAG TPA: TIM-barrel domain-containing protein [Chthoniobacterales bacterium]